MVNGYRTAIGIVVAAVAVFFVGGSVMGAGYYVDYDGGSDGNGGTSPQKAFKHCPGDAEATGGAAATKFVAGDTVIFRGGVSYRGIVSVPWSGSADKPITYDGNTKGDFGRGKAIIDGSEPVTEWRKVSSAAEVGGNPNWRKLYVTDLDAKYTFFSFNLYQGATYLGCGQDPNPKDAFYHDRLDTYLPAEAGKVAITATSVTDGAYFRQKSRSYYDGAYAAVWVRPSVIVYKRIRSYDPAAHSVTIDKISNRLYANRRAKYSLLNSLKFLDRPGEYYLDESHAADGKVPLVLWPPVAEGEGPKGVTISSRKYGFDIKGVSHVVIDGFKIYQQGGNRAAGIVKSGGGKSTGLAIRNNEISRVRTYPNRSAAILMGNVHHSVIEWNYIHENAYCAGLMLSHFDDSVARYNLLRKNGSTAVDYYNCHRSKLLGNIVRDNLGMHANGLTMYVGCTDILVEGNEVYNANGVTTNEGSRITIRNNIFDPGSSGSSAMGLWSSPPLNDLTVVNNICLGQIYIGNKGTGWVFRNNVIGGFGGRIQSDAQLSHNIYTRLGEAQARRKPGQTEKVVGSLKQLFVDPGRKDYRPKRGGPLIDAGTEAGVTEDFVGTRRPKGRAVDIGPYEFVPNGPRYPKKRADRLAAPAAEPSGK